MNRTHHYKGIEMIELRQYREGVVENPDQGRRGVQTTNPEHGTYTIFGISFRRREG